MLKEGWGRSRCRAGDVGGLTACGRWLHDLQVVHQHQVFFLGQVKQPIRTALELQEHDDASDHEPAQLQPVHAVKILD